MFLKRRGYTVRLRGSMLVITLSFLFLVIAHQSVKADSIYLPIVSNAQSSNGTIPDHQPKFGPPIHRPAQVILADKIGLDIAYQSTNGKAIDFVNQAPRATTTITNVATIDLEMGDMLVNGSKAYTYKYHTKTITQYCIVIKVYLDMPDNKFMTVTAVGCYDSLNPSLSPDKQYNDTYNVVNQMIDLVNPNPAMYYVWDLSQLQP